MVKKIDGATFKRMLVAGANRLEENKLLVDEMNVFPVPDGDTGTNMSMTIMAAAKEVAGLIDDDMESLAKAISSGSLRGARGNSGVILSQLFRGFCKVIKTEKEIDIAILTDAIEKAVETAYKAVMKPKEGTILTVAKGAAVKARELQKAGTTDMGEFLNEVIKHAEYVLSQTPEMLPVLKQAGVVDSGGQGLLEVMKGAYDAYLGKKLDFSLGDVSGSTPKVKVDVEASANIKYGYCTEFIILLTKHFNIKHEMDFKAYLESIGDSIVVVADDDIVKVHVHTNDPGMAIQKALTFGQLSNMKIDNMRLEHQEKVVKEAQKAAKAAEVKETPMEERKEVGFISVSVGAGMDEIFTGLGVDCMISGGQTMNPSTEDMLNAIEKVNADTIFMFPNNKNIILAANQVQYMVEDKKIVVIPTKTVAQGITAIINYVPDLSVEENEAVMLEEIQKVKTGQVTYAVRDTEIDNKVIHEGDYMGIGDAGILAVGRNQEEVTLTMVDEMMDEEKELISIYYGEEVTEEEAQLLANKIEEKYSTCDVELQYGGQPVYYYIISAE